MLGFILTVDAFRQENGAPRSVPGSQNWAEISRIDFPTLGRNIRARSLHVLTLER